MRFATCEIPIFKRHVLAVIDCGEIDAVRYFQDYAKKKEKEQPLLETTIGNDGWCQCCGGDVYIWVEEEKYSIFIHEMVHAAFSLCELIGAEIDEEIIARLVEYMKINLLDELDVV